MSHIAERFLSKPRQISQFSPTLNHKFSSTPNLSIFTNALSINTAFYKKRPADIMSHIAERFLSKPRQISQFSPTLNHKFSPTLNHSNFTNALSINIASTKILPPILCLISPNVSYLNHAKSLNLVVAITTGRRQVLSHAFYKKIAKR